MRVDEKILCCCGSSKASIALRKGINNLINCKSEKTLKKYGISIKDSDGNIKSLSDIINELKDKLGHLNKDSQAAVVSTIFGKEAMSGWLAIINYNFNYLN